MGFWDVPSPSSVAIYEKPALLLQAKVLTWRKCYMGLAQISGFWYIAVITTALFSIIYPLVTAFFIQRKWNVSWKYFLFGVLIFFLFQVVTRIPAVEVITYFLNPALKKSLALQLWFIAGLALTAGLFEETGRYVCFRWFMRKEPKTWEKAVMYGAGHGGLEAILLVGVGNIITAINVYAVQLLPISQLSASARDQLHAQFAAIAAEPVWEPLLGSWERLFTLMIQIGFSVLVAQVFIRGQIRWYWLAVALHFVVDFVSAAAPALFGSGVTVIICIELFIGVFGAAMVWVVFRLKNISAPAGDLPIESAP